MTTVFDGGFSIKNKIFSAKCLMGLPRGLFTFVELFLGYTFYRGALGYKQNI